MQEYLLVKVEHLDILFFLEEVAPNQIAHSSIKIILDKCNNFGERERYNGE